MRICSLYRRVNRSRNGSSFLDLWGTLHSESGYHARRMLHSSYSTLAIANEDIGKGTRKTTLAENLAFLVEETSHHDEIKPKSRIELKRSFELRIKKRVKEHYLNGKFQDLMAKVVASSETLQDAYNCIKLSSNVDIMSNSENISFDELAKEILSNNFDVKANTFSLYTKGANKEVLVLPKLKLKIVQEAIRISLEVVYKPHFSKISHGCRSGRGHATALKYVTKDVTSPDWWFTLLLNKKLDSFVFEKLISTMEDKIKDPGLYSVLRSMFNVQVLNLEFGGFPKGHGLPQEGLLSPILMNIYLDLLDREFYRLSMWYEALESGFHNSENKSHSKLRNWFRRQLKEDNTKRVPNENLVTRVHSCRFMDEIFFAVSGSKETALDLKSKLVDYLQNSLHLVVDNQTEISACQGPNGGRFLGLSIKRSVRESPAVRAVHKLKDKVRLFALQKEEAWNAGTLRIGKKWLGHGLKRVKESEIKHLADKDSTLSKISCFRKDGMETDHWYKVLLKIWIQDLNVKRGESEEFILSKYIAEPVLPQELRDSFYKFQKCAEEYVSSESAATLALLSNSSSSNESMQFTECVAPVSEIKKRFQRYGLIYLSGYARPNPFLVLQDSNQIIDWFAGIASRLLRWYKDCSNFSEIKLMVSDQVRKSCIRTLAVKYRIHEDIIEKRFDSEMSIIPSTQEIEQEMEFESLDLQQPSENDEALLYGISYSGSCLLSLARAVGERRPCNCFVTGCLSPAPAVYNLRVMERQRFPGWKTGFSSCIHPSLNGRRIGLCKKHLRDLYLGHISLQCIDFGAWK